MLNGYFWNKNEKDVPNRFVTLWICLNMRKTLRAYISESSKYAWICLNKVQNMRKLLLSNTWITRLKLALEFIKNHQILDPRNIQEKNFRTHKATMAQWHKTHETHNGKTPTEFRILLWFWICLNRPWVLNMP